MSAPFEVHIGTGEFVHMEEAFSESGLSSVTRMADAAEGLAYIRSLRLIDPQMRLFYVLRRGEEDAFDLTLHFDTRVDAAEVRRRVLMRHTERTNAATTSILPRAYMRIY
jgi:hypothetical protein